MYLSGAPPHELRLRSGGSRHRADLLPIDRDPKRRGTLERNLLRRELLVLEQPGERSTSVGVGVVFSRVTVGSGVASWRRRRRTEWRVGVGVGAGFVSTQSISRFQTCCGDSWKCTIA